MTITVPAKQYQYHVVQDGRLLGASVDMYHAIADAIENGHLHARLGVALAKEAAHGLLSDPKTTGGSVTAFGREGRVFLKKAEFVYDG